MDIVPIYLPLLGSSSKVPSWVKLIGGQAPILFANPATNQLWTPSGGTVALTSALTSTRNSPLSALNSDGSYTQVLANIPAVGTAGLNSWLASTNSALWSRDLTQSGTWTASNVTAAKNATGIFGDANAATTLTASASNGTILQTLSLAAGSTYSVFVKRLTGSGEIDITLNGGTAWTNIASLINSSGFTRVSIPNAAITSIGLRIVTNGDAVVVDVNQGEAVSFATPPILTTSAAVTRAADNTFMSLTVPAAYTLYAEGTPYAPTGYGTNQVLLSVNDGTNNNRVQLYRNAGTAGAAAFIATAGVGQTAPGALGTWAANTFGKAALGISSSTGFVAFNGSTGTAGSTITLPTVSQLNAGMRGNGDSQTNGLIGRFGVYPFAASAAQLQVATT